MSNVSLVIMAAGVGSRFKGGIKQLTPIGPNGELIIDYSIYDAIQAGFDKVVFIIRKELEEHFRQTIGERLEEKVEVVYAYQELEDVPAGFEEKLAKREKPWGTGQAILCCKDVVTGPFAVINADDYYGPTAFRVAYEKLSKGKSVTDQLDISMVGFVLENTLSDNGTVTRGICQIDEAHKLIDIEETYGIEKRGEQAIAVRDGAEIALDLQSAVSMNMWGFYPEIFDVLEEGFKEFLENIDPESNQKQEYLLPQIVGRLVREQKAQVEVLESPDKWFGVTYQEDKLAAQKSLQELIKKGAYPEKL